MCEIFFAVLRPFLNETTFYAKPSTRFASKFGTNMQLSNLKLLSKFYEARPKRSRVISKSLKPHVTRWCENARVKTKKHATRPSVVPITRKILTN